MAKRSKDVNSRLRPRRVSVQELDISSMSMSCDQVALVLKLLAHPQRLMILYHLVSGERMVSELQSLCCLGQSHTSQILNKLKLFNLIASRKEGTKVYYSIQDQRLVALVREIHKIYCG